jgi:hypothetical protein
LRLPWKLATQSFPSFGAEMNEHKHAWALRLIADGVSLNEFEVKVITGEGGWFKPQVGSFINNPDYYLVRRKERTHVVNGFIVPAPMIELPTDTYYTPSVHAIEWYCVLSHSGWTKDYLDRGLCFENKQAAIMNAMAMCGIDPSTNPRI